jgi:hypothetical protein
LAVVLVHHTNILRHFADGVLWAGLRPQGDELSALASWSTALDIYTSDRSTRGLRSQSVRNAIDNPDLATDQA